MSNKNEFLDELVANEKFYRQPRFWVAAALILIGGLTVFYFFSREIKVSMSNEEVAAAVQVVWHDSLWVDKVNRPDEVIIVPEISVKIKNTSEQEIRFLHLQAVFNIEGESENLGDGFVSALQKPLPPGETSPVISIKSSFGYTASSKKAFFDNIPEWRKVNARLFAKAHGSQWVPLGVYPIEQVIQGVKIVAPGEEELVN